jgi:hypothetical protein
MADDAAHIPTRPRREDRDGEIVAVSDADDARDMSGSVVTLPTQVRFGGTLGADVELIGRTAPAAATAATFGAREPMAAAIGATSIGRSSSAPSRTASGWAPPDRSQQWPDETPRWSFRSQAGAVDAPPPPPVDDARPQAPSAPPAALAPPPARPLPLFGPVGRPRSALLVPLLAALTLGVYALAWYQRTNRELEEFDPKLHARPRRTVLALVVPWLLGLLITVGGAALIVTSRLGVHLPFDPHVSASQAYYLLAGIGAVPYLTLLLSFSAVAVVMTLERLRSVEEHVGTTTDRQVRPVGSALLLAIPVVGGLLLLAVQQRRLNAVWGAVAPTGSTIS